MLNLGFNIYIFLSWKWVVTLRKSQLGKYTGHLPMWIFSLPSFFFSLPDLNIQVRHTQEQLAHLLRCSQVHETSETSFLQRLKRQLVFDLVAISSAYLKKSFLLKFIDFLLVTVKLCQFNPAAYSTNGYTVQSVTECETFHLLTYTTVLAIRSLRLFTH